MIIPESRNYNVCKVDLKQFVIKSLKNNACSNIIINVEI